MTNVGNRDFRTMMMLLAGLGVCTALPAYANAGRYVNDSVITTKVTSELIADKGLGAIHVDVHTVKGVVYLTGSIHTKQEADAAAKIAAHVSGVKSVDNDILIKK